MDPLIPPALVLGCNTPHGINVLSDWIEEHTGHAPDFAMSGWSDYYDLEFGSVDGDGRGVGFLYYLAGYRYRDGGGGGQPYSNGDGLGYGDTDGNGTGYGDGNIDGSGGS